MVLVRIGTEKWSGFGPILENIGPIQDLGALAVLPNGLIFSDFGPESDFFEQNGPELVRINTQKSGLGGNKQRQINNVLYLRDMDRS